MTDESRDLVSEDFVDVLLLKDSICSKLTAINIAVEEKLDGVSAIGFQDKAVFAVAEFIDEADLMFVLVLVREISHGRSIEKPL
jgi:hypothetical protein